MDLNSFYVLQCLPDNVRDLFILGDKDMLAVGATQQIRDRGGPVPSGYVEG